MKNLKNKKTGKVIIPPKLFPEKHELETASFLIIHLGYDVEFLFPSRTKGSTTADIVMNGTQWEIKSPKGQSKYTIKHSFKSACKQCENIIFNLHRLKTKDDICIKKIEREFKLSKTAKRILIITKTKKIIEM